MSEKRRVVGGLVVWYGMLEWEKEMGVVGKKEKEGIEMVDGIGKGYEDLGLLVEEGCEKLGWRVMELEKG